MNDLSSCALYVQFSDFDQTPNMLTDVPFGVLPEPGDTLNIRQEAVTYFLKVESVHHMVECDDRDERPHSITIDCKLLKAR